jgi:hypothetical protein
MAGPPPSPRGSSNRDHFPSHIYHPQTPLHYNRTSSPTAHGYLTRSYLGEHTVANPRYYASSDQSYRDSRFNHLNQHQNEQLSYFNHPPIQYYQQPDHVSLRLDPSQPMPTQPPQPPRIPQRDNAISSRNPAQETQDTKPQQELHLERHNELQHQREYRLLYPKVQSHQQSAVSIPRDHYIPHRSNIISTRSPASQSLAYNPELKLEHCHESKQQSLYRLDSRYQINNQQAGSSLQCFSIVNSSDTIRAQNLNTYLDLPPRNYDHPRDQHQYQTFQNHPRHQGFKDSVSSDMRDSAPLYQHAQHPDAPQARPLPETRDPSNIKVGLYKSNAKVVSYLRVLCRILNIVIGLLRLVMIYVL